MHVRGRPLEPIGVLTGGKGGTPIIHEANSVGSNWFQKWKKKFYLLYRQPCCVSHEGGQPASRPVELPPIKGNGYSHR